MADDSDNETESKISGEGRQVIVILDLATLETVKTKKGDFQLLNCDDHIGIMKKHNKDPSKFRPDIVHQEMMAVLDSPLNKAGKVKMFVHTEKNVLIEVNPKTRLPRTFKRFSGLMVQLLHRLKIRSADGRDMLLKVRDVRTFSRVSLRDRFLIEIAVAGCQESYLSAYSCWS
jgi:rRNA small subunit pseudouridine methyltransferase Nep1